MFIKNLLRRTKPSKDHNSTSEWHSSLDEANCPAP